MRALLFFVFCIAIGTVLRGCLKERYVKICVDLCDSQGYETGYMPNNWDCQCEGFKREKKKRIIRP